ncbi:MAG: ORF6N domain-containing protein [Bacteroidales bacterium]|nr:ORF6N domain-containing protein [Bacteroidales bacterium]
MPEKKNIIISDIQNRIYTIRGLQVMLDSDLAELYHVETKNLNLAVKRNIERFPDSFRFQLTVEEYKSLRLQIETSKEQRGGRRYLPFVFTEQGVAMLSAVLRSETAVKVSIQIMQAFIEMKKFISINAGIFQRLDKIEKIQINDKSENGEKFDLLFKALENKNIKPDKGIFYQGQIFDAYVFVSDLIKSAKKSILLIDNYIDETILQLFTKRNENVAVTIYTKNINKILKQDLEKHNSQYPAIEIKQFSKAHDRFLIIDDITVYHIGASLKDLGKKLVVSLSNHVSHFPAWIPKQYI